MAFPLVLVGDGTVLGGGRVVKPDLRPEGRQGKAFFFEKKKQKTGRTALRPCPGLSRASTRLIAEK
jgi:hypothetical protein